MSEQIICTHHQLCDCYKNVIARLKQVNEIASELHHEISVRKLDDVDIAVFTEELKKIMGLSSIE